MNSCAFKERSEKNTSFVFTCECGKAEKFLKENYPFWFRGTKWMAHSSRTAQHDFLIPIDAQYHHGLSELCPNTYLEPTEMHLYIC